MGVEEREKAAAVTQFVIWAIMIAVGAAAAGWQGAITALAAYIVGNVLNEWSELYRKHGGE